MKQLSSIYHINENLNNWGFLNSSNRFLILYISKNKNRYKKKGDPDRHLVPL